MDRTPGAAIHWERHDTCGGIQNATAKGAVAQAQLDTMGKEIAATKETAENLEPPGLS